jgi:hypothetical protein
LEIADKVIRDFVSELREVLFSRKMVVFPGLGRLRATKENAVFFIPDEDLDIYPEGFALEPISLKTHVETKEEVAVVMEELKQIVVEPQTVEEQIETESDDPVVESVQEPVAEPVIEKEPVAESTPVAEPEVQEKKKPSFWRVLGKTLLILVIAAVAALGAYLLVAHFMPEFLDNILYTPEELEIINKSIC